MLVGEGEPQTRSPVKGLVRDCASLDGTIFARHRSSYKNEAVAQTVEARRDKH